MRDTQRQKVYDWEWKTTRGLEKEELSLLECKMLVANVWAAYRPGQRIPDIKNGQGTRWARGSWYEINLPRWARNKIIVLHETAHSLSPAGAPHGPEFVRLYIELLVRWAGLDRKKLVDSARAARIKIGRWDAVPQPKVRVRVWKDLSYCRHDWSPDGRLSSKMTAQGMVVLHRAVCEVCGESRP